jgi:hypothetical protein
MVRAGREFSNWLAAGPPSVIVASWLRIVYWRTGDRDVDPNHKMLEGGASAGAARTALALTNHDKGKRRGKNPVMAEPSVLPLTPPVKPYRERQYSRWNL